MIDAEIEKGFQGFGERSRACTGETQAKHFHGVPWWARAVKGASTWLNSRLELIPETNKFNVQIKDRLRLELVSCDVGSFKRLRNVQKLIAAEQ